MYNATYKFPQASGSTMTDIFTVGPKELNLIQSLCSEYSFQNEVSSYYTDILTRFTSGM